MNHRVKQLRLNAGISQKEMARRLSISVIHLNRVENGKRELGIMLAYRIAHILNCSIDDIFLK